MNEKVRERIAKEIGQHAENCPWDDCSKEEQDAAFRSADFILSDPGIKEGLELLEKHRKAHHGKV